MSKQLDGETTQELALLLLFLYHVRKIIPAGHKPRYIWNPSILWTAKGGQKCISAIADDGKKHRGKQGFRLLPPMTTKVTAGPRTRHANCFSSSWQHSHPVHFHKAAAVQVQMLGEGVDGK